MKRHNREGEKMSKTRINLPKKEITEFCQRWKIREFSLFGSVLRDDLRLGSDIDVIVDFEPEVRYSLFDMVSMIDDLEEIFGREVDLLTRQAVEQSRNYIRRKAILSSREVIYVS